MNESQQQTRRILIRSLNKAIERGDEEAVRNIRLELGFELGTLTQEQRDARFDEKVNAWERGY